MSAPPVKVVPLPPWGSAIAGATGAVAANALVYPLDMYALHLNAYGYVG